MKSKDTEKADLIAASQRQEFLHQRFSQPFNEEERAGYEMRRLFVGLYEDIKPENMEMFLKCGNRIQTNKRFRDLLLRKMRRINLDLTNKLQKFVEDRSTAYKSGVWVSATIRRITDLVVIINDSTGLNSDKLLTAKNSFSNYIKNIENGGATLVINKDQVLEAVIAAFATGIECGRHSDVTRMWNEWNDKRTRPAREARRANAVQSAIETAAFGLWQKKPSKRENPTATATEIWPALKAQFTELENLPRGWRLEDWGSDKKMIERIRQRIRRMARSDS